MNHRVWIVCVLLSAAACAAEGPSSGPAPTPTPTPTPTPAPAPTVTGRWTVVSTVDLTVGAVLPEPIANYVEALRRTRDDPGHAFFDLLEEAGVPLVDELRAVLPDVVEDAVADYITEALGGRLTAEIDRVLEDVDIA